MASDLTLESTVQESIDRFLEGVADERSVHTYRLYRNALRAFTSFLDSRGIRVHSVTLAEVSEDWLGDYVKARKSIAPSTERGYVTGIIRWYEFLASKQLASTSTTRLRLMARPRTHQPKQSITPPPTHYNLSRVVDYAAGLVDVKTASDAERLRLLRDRALILTLADTDLPISALCNLRRGNIDWRTGRLVLTGKDTSKATMSLSPRTLNALRDYLKARSPLDDSSNRSATSLPLFSRHNQGVGKRVLPVSTRTIQTIVAKRRHEALGAEDDGTITPVSFRHYFATAVLQSFASLHPKIAQRCQVLFESGHYDEAIFNAMKVVEEEIRSAVSASPADIGIDLITKAMHPKSPLIEFSQVNAEQESVYFLYRGAIGAFKNPLSHRFMGTSDPVKTFECLSLASLLVRMLDEAN